jgi:hypothetical protein
MKKLATVVFGLLLAAGLAGYLFAAGSAPDKSVTGTLEDSYCYGAMGAKGASHKQCAAACARKGIPVALVDANGNIHILLPAKNDQPLPDDVFSKMEEQVTVTGKEYSKGGVNFLTAESVK